MSKKSMRRRQRPPQRPQKKRGQAQRPRRKLVIIVGLLLLLSLTGGIFARWRDLGINSPATAMLAPPAAPITPAPVPTSSPLVLSKEYIYAGGKLVATEEPVSTATPTPTPSPSPTPSPTPTPTPPSGNAPPSVSLTAPALAATYTAPANISITAAAADADGTISKVEFFQGSVKLGETTAQPYTFVWNNAAKGNYTLTAKATDNSGAATTSAAVNIMVYDQIENAAWADAVNVQPTGNSLSKTGTASAWDSGAVSTRELASGDGYVEFTVGEKNNHKMGGLSFGDTDQDYGDIDFAIYPNYTGNVYIYEGGQPVSNGASPHFGTYEPGDRFRVSIEGGVVTYRQNGQLLHQSTGVTPAYPLRVDTTLWSPSATIGNVVLGGTLRTALPQENVSWANGVNASAIGNSLWKSGTASAWDSGASSSKAITSGDGYVEFIVSETDNHKMCGLSSDDADQSYGDIDFAIYPNYTGNVYIYEHGQPVSNGSNPHFGNYVAGDRFRVSVENGAVTYRQNGKVLYSHSQGVTLNYPLRVDTSMWSPNVNIRKVVIGGQLQPTAASTQNVVWTNPIKVTVSGNSLSRSASTNAWDGGASSVQKLAAGDGYVEFTATGGGYRMCGLSKGSDADQNYAEIDYAIYLSANGLINIYEHGIWRGEFESYAEGDKLRISVEGGQIKYWHRSGQSSTFTQINVANTPLPSYPLRVDTSLYTPDAAINNVVISGYLTQ